MNFKLLETFIAVIDHQTMSQAAEHLFTSQPNVSMMIMELEDYFSTKLFYRTSKGLKLTPAGSDLEHFARKIIHDLNEMNQQMFSQKRSLRIGSSVTVGHYLLDNYLQVVKTTMPNLHFDIMISNTESIEEAILANHLDIAIVEGIVESSRVCQVDLEEDELVAVLSADYPIEQPITQLQDLNLLPWIAREEGSHRRNQFELDLKERKIHPKVVFSATNLDTILQAVEHQYGFAVFSKFTFEEAQKKQNLERLSFADYHCPRSIRAIYRKDVEKDPLIKGVLHCIQSDLQKGSDYASSENNTDGTGLLFSKDVEPGDK